MSVHYKFKSALEYDTITFDGLHISVKDLKNAIIQQKRIGKSTDFDLQVTNAQTKEVYTDENVLIPKNTSLLIARIPNATQSKPKQWEGYGGDSSPTLKSDDGGPIAKATDLSSLDAPEDDKIKAMMSQSTQDYDPSNYQKIRGSNQMGAVPPTYRCYKCHQTGHWIKDCTFGQGADAVEIKKSTGIPQSFMVPVEGPQVPGAMMTPNGSFAVPVLDHQAYNFKPVPAPIVQELKPDIPEDLVCSICTDLLADAVMIPCCGNSFCDECIRFFLLESEDHECPDCHEKDISPGTLIPNRFLRKSVANFKNTTGYIKKPIFRPPPKEVPIPKKEAVEDHKTEMEKNEKTVISEADSTEPVKNKPVEKKEEKPGKTELEPQKDGPPGVSPVESPVGSQIKRLDGTSRDVNGNGKKRSDYSPKQKTSHGSGSQYERERNSEDRAGTPTIDEPGVSSNNYQYNSENPQTSISNIMPITGVQGPPPNVPLTYPPGQQPISTYPPTTGPPPNFGLPPPNNVPYMPPGPYANPPRPIFDPSRPPMTGPPPFNPPFQSRPPHHRDYDRGMRNRTPPGIIDDTLAAFNRILREKDERERRAKQRLQRRTYSRSRSRSRSYSPRSPRRMRSRSPRRRSRSRSFSLSRRYKDSHPPERRERDDYEREYRRDDRDYTRDHPPRREREHDRTDREYRGTFDSFEDRYRAPKGQWNTHSMGMRAPPEAYYNPPPPEIVQSAFQQPPNRYNPRDYPPPYMGKPDAMIPIHPIPPRKYDDVAPPGVEEPPVPGLENSPRTEDKFSKVEPPADVKEEKRTRSYKDSDKSHRSDREKDREREKHRSDRDRDTKRDSRKERDSDRKKRSNRSTTPQKKRSHSRERDTPEKRRRKYDGSSDREKSDKEKKRDYSDEDKSRKSKDKKKKREKEKKEKDKKKRDKKEKHKEKDKDKKVKEEIKDKEQSTEGQKSEPCPTEEIPAKRFKSDSPKMSPEKADNQSKPGLYDDVIEDNIEQEIKENFEEKPTSNTPEHHSNYTSQKEETNEIEEGELERSREYEDSEKDILELHSNDIDLKTELESRNEMLAPLPEKSKWEDDDDNMGELSPSELKGDSKNSKSGTVSSEVLKRAENAIFAKAINAIRPIEIKKISADRAKFYSGERNEDEVKPVTVQSVAIEKKTEKKVESSNPPKLSVKDRLGIKVNEPDPVLRVNSVSPFSRRLAERNYGYGERKGEEDRKRDDRHKREVRSRDRRDRDDKDSRRDRGDSHRHKEVHRRDDKRNRSRSKTKTKEAEKTDKKRRSRSRSESEDRKDKKRKKEKKQREKSRKKDDKEEKGKEEKQEVPKTATEKRKPTLDEATFEPDYDLESEAEDKKGDSSSSDSDSSSSSEEERRRKRRKKHRKKKYRKDSSSSSSDSDSDSSEEERERKRKKHKKNKKKRKKSKNK
ncbi:E3 ubiquitin-protein ligase RBBP6 isoform X2 [Coccinella septempunctata]|uniref:E3 ubiquitin-protein ligase RBBP6 isoform X2 n=1 Tax=Coccinella septempunctata TaxID=41139 RepID=UPI001D064346|nr:E3 ubiquitin-protein ligase RBBP6 isoform X2 [Coccinella septempunctata]